ncbi:hypothetical protein AB1K83_02800 [Sporosarcina sp. 179-K 3D1 HS]|uniref:hypothetical protein n=1 Tax=Sporosarcina sp. 179-K 3D1 HS TaxID=3232169 RepID=UPI0039A26CBF
MPKEIKDSNAENKMQDPKQIGQEYSDEERRKNEVASSEYTGGGKGKVDLQHDKNETGGF